MKKIFITFKSKNLSRFLLFSLWGFLKEKVPPKCGLSLYTSCATACKCFFFRLHINGHYFSIFVIFFNFLPILQKEKRRSSNLKGFDNLENATWKYYIYNYFLLKIATRNMNMDAYLIIWKSILIKLNYYTALHIIVYTCMHILVLFLFIFCCYFRYYVKS